MSSCNPLHSTCYYVLSHVFLSTRCSSMGFATSPPSALLTSRSQRDWVHGRAWGPCTNPIGFSWLQHAAEEMLQNIWHGGAKAQTLHVNGLEQSGMASCAAHFGSIHGGRVRGHSGARIRAPRAHLCCPLSTCVVCAPRVIVGSGCCCSGARIDEWTRQNAAARCSTPAYITRSAWDHRALRQIDGVPLFRGVHGGIGAPQWLPRALWAPQASRARVVCVGRGPGARGRCT